jgi:hypothetical protein
MSESRLYCGAEIVRDGVPSFCMNAPNACRWHKPKGRRTKTPKGCKWAGGCTGTAREGGRYCDEHAVVEHALGDHGHRYMESRLRDLQVAFSAVPLATAVPVRPEPNTVDHPRHYNVGKIEAITVIEDWNLGFNLGNCLKYLARCDHKGNAVEDLKKALWYLQRELERRQA